MDDESVVVWGLSGGMHAMGGCVHIWLAGWPRVVSDCSSVDSCIDGRHQHHVSSF